MLRRVGAEVQAAMDAVSGACAREAESDEKSVKTTGRRLFDCCRSRVDSSQTLLSHQEL